VGPAPANTVALALSPKVKRASGDGKARVGLYGIVKNMWQGMPSFSATWMWPYVGGFAMIACAVNGSEPATASAQKEFYLKLFT